MNCIPKQQTILKNNIPTSVKDIFILQLNLCSSWNHDKITSSLTNIEWLYPIIFQTIPQNIFYPYIWHLIFGLTSYIFMHKILKTWKITSSVEKGIEVNEKMSTHSVVHSDNFYPMLYVYLCVCVCIFWGWKRKIFTHAQ